MRNLPLNSVTLSSINYVANQAGVRETNGIWEYQSIKADAGGM